MFENMHIETNDTEVSIMSDGIRMWGMNIQNVADTLKFNADKFISEWVTHLTEKNWASPELLYEFASEIQRLHPDNDIDWYLTFMMVERADYLDKSFEMKQSLSQGDDKPKRGNLMDRIRFGQNSFNDIERTAVKEIIISKLNEHHLPFSAY